MTRLSFIFLSCISFFSVSAQNYITEQDYQRAESLLGDHTAPLIDRGSAHPNWLPGDRFWYRTLTPQGSEFILVDPVKGKKSHAFDHQKLASALSAITGKTVHPYMLPFQSFSYSGDGKSILFRAGGQQWKVDLQTYTPANDTSLSVTRGDSFRRRGNEVVSPDGNKVAFIRDWNLWMRDVKSNKETQLTRDGVKDFGYATDNAGWSGSDAPVLRWSPDSRKIATFRQDQRHVGDMYLVTTNVGHPELQAWKYPLPGDKNIPMIQRVIIEVDVPKLITLNVAPDPHRASLSDDISSSGTFDDVDWSTDGNELAFLSTSRDHKQEKFRIANAVTGQVREVFEEVVATQYESGQGTINWKYLPKTKEIVWYSERDDWGHLYLYDAGTGKLKHQITKGEWVVTALVKVDEKNRVLFFYACGLQKENPYFASLYRIGFDGKNMTLLTPGIGNHSAVISPSGNYILDVSSRPDVPQTVVVRDFNGKQMLEVQKTDVSRLQAKGWKPPIPITVKSDNARWDLYGLMFTPSHLDPAKRYPVINYIYPGPQGGSVGSWSFSASRSDHQALAELGFVVVLIEGSGNPLRSKSFHDAYWPDMSTNTLPDQVAGIRQLAQRYPYMDTTRIGIWGHSGGGFATAAAMFRYPDFFKVGISESGNHDNRNYEDDWGERYIGLLNSRADGKDNYERQANQVYAKNLKGKLMLAHGLMDNNVPPYNTWLVVDALQKANKDFDLVIFPHARHGFGTMSAYMMRKRWDYFVRHLLGAEPPKEYQFKTVNDPRNVSLNSF